MINPVGHFRIHRELYHKPIWKLSTPEQKTVLMTLLAMAWFKPNEWEWKGQKFKTEPGQFVTSLQSIADDCGKGISIQNVRSSLKRFENLEFLTNESTKQGRLITIANWDLYQFNEDNPTKQSTKTQQRPNKDPTTKEERKKDKKERSNIFIPPSIDEVRQYCKERNNTVDAESFINFYESKGWMVGKNKMKSWKAAVRTWEKNSKPKEQPKNQFQNFDQRQKLSNDEYERKLGIRK